MDRTENSMTRRQTFAALPARAGMDQFIRLAGLTGPAQHADGGSYLARVSLQAAEEQGGLIQLA